MSLKPTIYKFRLNLADLDREIYHGDELTLALHPSETPERMLARLMAWCLLVDPAHEPALGFCKGLSDTEEPDLWRVDYDETIPLWVEVGEPSHDLVKKAARSAQQVVVLSFNSKSDTWWSQNAAKLRRDNVRFLQLDWPALEQLAGALARTQDWSVTVSGEQLFVSTDDGSTELTCKALH